MSLQPGHRGDDEPTLATMLKALLDRDSRQAETAQLMLQRQADQNVAIQGLQGEVSRLIEIAKQQQTYNERQIQLAEQLAAQTQAAQADRQAREKVDEKVDGLAIDVAGARGGTRMLGWIVGISAPLLVSLLFVAYTALSDRIAETKADAAREREAIRADIRELQAQKRQTP